jgi:DNA damage-inducible protein 1
MMILVCQQRPNSKQKIGVQSRVARRRLGIDQKSFRWRENQNEREQKQKKQPTNKAFLLCHCIYSTLLYHSHLATIMSNDEITITLCNPLTGQSESMPVSKALSVAELTDWSKALLGVGNGNVQLVKDGRPLTPTLTLEQAGVEHGDLVAAVVPKVAAAAGAAPAAQQQAQSSSGGGALDFSNLLAPPASASASAAPVYYAGMTLADAADANPHPAAIVTLLQQHLHLSKELNYHNPTLAQKLLNQPFDRAVQIWREEMVKGGIQTAFAQSQAFHKEQDFTRRLQQNPNDTQAKEHFDNQRRRVAVNQQYHQAMNEYPESMGRVLMLYVEAKINETTLQAFVDSGAQATIMSKKCAIKCGIFDLVDTRFAGVAVGVGTGKILGRIHICQLQIGNTFFPCSVTVMDDMTMPTAGKSSDGSEAAPKDMDFLLGLDMLKRHLCSIDLEQGKLKFRLAPGQYLETPFLHEKDLDESKGGTKGFNAEKSNEELMELQRKRNDKEDDDGDMQQD